MWQLPRKGSDTSKSTSGAITYPYDRVRVARA